MNLAIDTSVHPAFATDHEFRSYLPETMRTRGFPGTERPWYQAPGGEFLEHTYGEGFPWAGGYPGSNVKSMVEDVLERPGIECAVLHPLSRGVLPDWLLASGVCSATNTWLAEKYLEAPEAADRFRGTINVNPQDPEGAVKEILRWKDHRHMVQVGVPLQSRELYGRPQFQPIWRAAADAGLPVAVHVSQGTGIEGAPTPAGHTRTYPHYASYMPLNYFHHLTSLILDGSFQRIPDLKFVFADGGADILTSLIWRFDTFWRAMREQTPWITRQPSSFLAEHVRFVWSDLEGPTDPSMVSDWFQMSGQEDLIMYGSNYPYWSTAPTNSLPEGLLEAQRQKILFENAAALYGLQATEAVK